jgi:hypothetical protein
MRIWNLVAKDGAPSLNRSRRFDPMERDCGRKREASIEFQVRDVYQRRIFRRVKDGRLVWRVDGARSVIYDERGSWDIYRWPWRRCLSAPGLSTEAVGGWQATSARIPSGPGLPRRPNYHLARVHGYQKNQAKIRPKLDFPCGSSPKIRLYL